MIHWTKLSALRGTCRIASCLMRTLLLVGPPRVVIGIETAEYTWRSHLRLFATQLEEIDLWPLCFIGC